ncbi:DUF4194 domain-containing protein [Corynebacterium felinum]|uniref:DUF4194 domain-containing protein n=1 Tax=Corynebacterium felinum TaxID=131318 RepID=A0ABU2BBN6_9CORY|nr:MULTISPECIES: DUF4194 domain-containing protein [Corynebacterium]MDF5819832.1 DUF4194 domain-containing protein [Corynebacterium felinum]MDO4762488.1 DUF4194 domain-containing protein [Corynebacterium sp.]MDR7356026.1 hypothetical protein [Corynebacterium felinum]WJY95361.1 hypothetical protein CFELI_08780 [Corynebacterium felinum]
MSTTQPHSTQHTPVDDKLWESDTGTLSFDSRRALAQLLQGPLVRARQQPHIWHAILTDETALRSRLADIFLDLIVDEDAGIAFTRTANGGAPLSLGGKEVEVPKVLRTKTMTIIDTALLLYMRTQLGLAAPGERVLVDAEELRDNARLYRRLEDRDESTFDKRLSASLKRMITDYALLSPTETDDRYEVSPVLRHLFDPQVVEGIRAEFTQLLEKTTTED